MNKILLATALILSSCTFKYVEDTKHDELVENNDYGIWNLADCAIAAQRSEMSIGLTHIYDKDEVARVVVKSKVDLQEVPVFKIHGLPDYDINLTGAGRAYVLELPVDLQKQARMHLNKMFMEIKYRPLGLDHYRRAIFPLQGLPEAILSLQNSCS